MDLTDRLYQRLLDALSTSPADARSLTIGDIYQRLIPYRAVRGDLGVLELAQYEHALLRLLAGEGGYLRVDGGDAAREFTRELGSPNPILGLYRDYADATVVLLKAGQGSAQDEADDADSLRPSADAPTTAAMPATPPTPATPDASAPPAAPARSARPASSAMPDAPTSVARPSISPAPATADTTGARTSAARPASSPAPATAETPDAAPSTSPVCRNCDRPLPAISGIRYCPYCGSRQPPPPCARCGAPLDGDWKFCIRCGTPRV